MIVKNYTIKNSLDYVVLSLYSDFETLCVIPFDKDFIKTKKKVFDKILFCCEKWNLKISKRKANEIAKKVKFYF